MESEPVRNRRRIKLTDILFILGFVAVIAVLSLMLVRQLSLKHEVADAKVVANRVITDVQKQRASDALDLGDKTFQENHSPQELQSLFKAAQLYVSGSATVSKQVVTNSKKNDVVSIIYKFHTKKPYYLRVTVGKINGTDKWYLIGLGGNASEATLLKK